MTGPIRIGDEQGILVARLPEARRYEPIIVTTLRRYVRRQASPALLHRIAGGAGHFRVLNQVWDLDGRGLGEVLSLPRAKDLPALGLDLSADERRIALFQIIAEHARAGWAMPTTVNLARFFGVSRSTIDNDIELLRAEGRIACEREPSARLSRRVIRPVEEPAP